MIIWKRMAGLLLVALIATGCDDTPQYSPVEGTVYYNDGPVASGVVMFQPTTGEMARGVIQPDGKYTLETLGKSPGVAPGICKVRVSVREQSPNAASEVGLGKLLIPDKYTDFDSSGLAIEVTMGGSEPYDIHLTD